MYFTRRHSARSSTEGRTTKGQCRDLHGQATVEGPSIIGARIGSRFEIAAFGALGTSLKFQVVSISAPWSVGLPIPIRIRGDRETLPSFRMWRNPRRESSHAAGVRRRPAAANSSAGHTSLQSWMCMRPRPRGAGRKGLVRSLSLPRRRVRPRSDDANRQQYSAHNSHRCRGRPLLVPGSTNAMRPASIRSRNPPSRLAANCQRSLLRSEAHHLSYPVTRRVTDRSTPRQRMHWVLRAPRPSDWPAWQAEATHARRSANLASISHWMSAKTIAVDTPNRSIPLAASSGPKNLQCAVMITSP
jgi:hypothetical protein